jgi:chromosome segregation ATPase
MTLKDYLNKLLGLCTDKQKDFFDLMYPGGPTKKQLSWATKQLENTLSGLNQSNEKLVYIKRELEKANKNAASASREWMNTKNTMEQELQDAHALIERLRNPISTANNNVQERLELLDALEAGGVDSWSFYDEAVSNYED